MDEPLSDLITTYHELNAAVVDELHEEPSALEFMRHVAMNRPFVARRAAAEWTACERWDAAYLRRAMAGDEVKVAVTPSGNADAVVEAADGSLVFVEPHEIVEPFGDFLSAIQEPLAEHVRYAQTQNDNLRNEYSPLLEDVPSDIPFARIALGQSADAINFWLGNHRSTTALHKDNYENIYVQIRGEKHFVLLSPAEMPCVNEQMLRRGRYAPVNQGAASVEKANVSACDDDGDKTSDGGLKLGVELVDGEPIPVATWDPDSPSHLSTPYSHLSRPLRVTLRPGDMLYLPSLWYHTVAQTAGEEGFACAVNYWYDMDFSGHHWASNTFVRDVYWARRPPTAA
ncbi:hypothetical protein LTR53_017962 [Teratosphaeriaceae sp. CCFEE 6253]|nr:hypothetical protein LTR53_017962 [Teratosphaeriaceae sp. CCFEE 6253]